MACSVADPPASSARTVMYKESFVIASPCLLPSHRPERNGTSRLAEASSHINFKIRLQGLFLPDCRSVRHALAPLVSARSRSSHFAVICMSQTCRQKRNRADGVQKSPEAYGAVQL